MRLFLLMLVVTTIEVILIAKVGSAIGFLWTFLIIIGTAILGSRLLSKQWRFVMNKLQTLQGNNLSQALLEALVLLICGVLLITPGFLTDIIGFLGLIPTVREQFIPTLSRHSDKMVQSHFRMSTSSRTFGDEPLPSRHNDDVIDGEFQRKDE